MKITVLEWRGSHRIEVSETELSALRKVVDAGLAALESEDEADRWGNFTSGELKAMAYWHGNPFSEEAEAARAKISQTAKRASRKRLAKPQKRPKDGPQAA
jgi:hypothetical protein